MVEDMTHLPADIQNYMRQIENDCSIVHFYLQIVFVQKIFFLKIFRKLAELDPPIYLTEEEIENYKEAFVDYDVDGSGNINILGKSFLNFDNVQSVFPL